MRRREFFRPPPPPPRKRRAAPAACARHGQTATPALSLPPPPSPLHAAAANRQSTWAHHVVTRHRRRRPVPVVGRDSFWRALVPASRSRSGRTPGHAATSGPGTRATARPDCAIHDRGRPPNGHTSDGRRASREEQIL